YGADGARVGMLLSSPAGNDLMFDEDLCKQGGAFANEIWNAFRLVKGWEISTEIEQPETAKIAVEWYESKFQQVLSEIEDHFEKYRISDALMATYKLVWDDFCSWFLEMVKPVYQQPIDAKTYTLVISIFENNLKLLHPFMPFLTEEIWHHIEERPTNKALIIAEWPEFKEVNSAILKEFDFAAEVISGIRTIRKEKNIPNKETLNLSVINNDKVSDIFDCVIKKLGNIENISYVNDKTEGAMSFRVKSNEYFIPVEGAIDVEAEITKLEAELKYTEGFLQSVRKKLSNERFVNSAPEQVVAIEKKKEADAVAKIETIKESLSGLK